MNLLSEINLPADRLLKGRYDEKTTISKSSESKSGARVIVHGVDTEYYYGNKLYIKLCRVEQRAHSICHGSMALITEHILKTNVLTFLRSAKITVNTKSGNFPGRVIIKNIGIAGTIKSTILH